MHTIEEDCNKSNVKAHLEERTGVEELPYVTLDGENLGPYSQVIAMSETGDLYKTIHGVVRLDSDFIMTKEDNILSSNKICENVQNFSTMLEVSRIV